MKKLLFTILTTSALTASLFAAQNEKFTGKDNWITGGAVFTIKPSATFSIANTASAPQIARAFYLGNPASTRTIVTATAITANATTYAIANQPDAPRLLQTVRALTSTTDSGVISVTIVGTDINDSAISETILVDVGATTTPGTRAFKTVSSVTQVGTNSAVDGADTVAVTCQAVYGLPVIPVANQTFALTTSGSTVAAGAVVTNSEISKCTVAVTANNLAKLWVYLAR